MTPGFRVKFLVRKSSLPHKTYLLISRFLLLFLATRIPRFLELARNPPPELYLVERFLLHLCTSRLVERQCRKLLDPLPALSSK